MADTKISALTALTGAGAASGDKIPIDDVSATTTKSITVAELLIALGGASTIMLVSDKATDAQVFAGTSGTHWISSSHITSSDVAVALTSTAASIAVDWATGINFSHTATENTTLANPTNGIPGTWRRFEWTQHASSPKTLAFGTNYKKVGGSAITVTATNSAVDVLMIYCRSSSIFEIYASLNLS